MKTIREELKSVNSTKESFGVSGGKSQKAVFGSAARLCSSTPVKAERESIFTAHSAKAISI